MILPTTSKRNQVEMYYFLHRSFPQKPAGVQCALKISTEPIIREFIGVNSGFIRFVLELIDGCELHVFEYIDSSLHKIDYSYHWLNKEKN